MKIESILQSELGLNFEFYLSESFSSKNTHYRNLIRDLLIAELKKKDQSENSSWRELKAVPQAEDWAISISHCKSIGGFILAKTNYGVGFDVEVSARMSDENLLRVSDSSEIDAAPSSAYLWVAKEAAFKSLYQRGQPVTLGPLRLDGWKELENGFKFASPSQLNGFSWQEGPLTYAVSVCTAPVVDEK